MHATGLLSSAPFSTGDSTTKKMIMMLSSIIFSSYYFAPHLFQWLFHLGGFVFSLLTLKVESQKRQPKFLWLRQCFCSPDWQFLDPLPQTRMTRWNTVNVHICSVASLPSKLRKNLSPDCIIWHGDNHERYKVLCRLIPALIYYSIIIMISRWFIVVNVPLRLVVNIHVELASLSDLCSLFASCSVV